ncbi:helix-turn-helix transcriptional regulator [uncultured Sulfitobacter sp.]|uniref:ArsR/SmtB family transcription factor n=1 Tax=uncultured Sulfitobacter sp. TaxID=191468 RepID=UPI0026319CC5|nr:helix-turn-helix transcriptional regulator [uncultured Sulfitobacter sp.]
MTTNDSMDAVFHALAHTTRREMLDHLRADPGLPVGKLASHFDVSRIAVMNHLAVLEKAGLVICEKEGRTRKLYLNAMPIQDIHERWTDTYSAHWADRVNIIKHAAEAAVPKLQERDDDD